MTQGMQTPCLCILLPSMLADVFLDPTPANATASASINPIAWLMPLEGATWFGAQDHSTSQDGRVDPLVNV
jgi:hypothetical protein